MEPCTLLIGTHIHTTTVGNSLENPQILKIKLLSVPTIIALCVHAIETKSIKETSPRFMVAQFSTILDTKCSSTNELIMKCAAQTPWNIIQPKSVSSHAVCNNTGGSWRSYATLQRPNRDSSHLISYMESKNYVISWKMISKCTTGQSRKWQG